MDYVDIRVRLDRETDSFGDESYDFYKIHSIESITDHANEVLLDNLLEELTQSDYGQIKIAQALLTAVGGSDTSNADLY